MSDILDMAYINSLPQPFLGRMWGRSDDRLWPIHDIEVATGLVRIDVCGLLEVKHIGDFKSFRDANGTEHSAEGFFADALPEERAAIAQSTGSASC
jgi:hypothetical protein